MWCARRNTIPPEKSNCLVVAVVEPPRASPKHHHGGGEDIRTDGVMLPKLEFPPKAFGCTYIYSCDSGEGGGVAERKQNSSITIIARSHPMIRLNRLNYLNGDEQSVR